MSDSFPVVEVPESTGLRALAHALDPDAEVSGDDLVPTDDAAASTDVPIETAEADDEALDLEAADELTFDDPFDDGEQLWSDPIDDPGSQSGHDDGIG